MSIFVLSGEEIEAIQALVREIEGQHSSCESPSLLAAAAVYGQELPRRLRQYLTDFRLNEPEDGICIVKGYPVDDGKIGRTPEHWKLSNGRSPALGEEIFLLLCGSLLGDCIGWSTQQDGHLVHDLLPIRGLENEQLGTGSKELLWWHTEDAFHPLRGDYLGMLCLRNPDRVATTYASLRGIRLDPDQWRLLFEPHFTIRPDESHLKKNKGASDLDESLEQNYQRIEQMNSRPEKIAVLHGDRSSPYIRIDPYFMDPVEDPAAQRALDSLIQAIEESLEDVVLEPGDVCLIDNFKGVHGRKPFTARYDGTDRWLKRINITRDLRKSREVRKGAGERIIL
jgi:Fe(II)/alpha-ketoglutarate-dependent arginine beta-hydroxylase